VEGIVPVPPLAPQRTASVSRGEVGIHTPSQNIAEEREDSLPAAPSVEAKTQEEGKPAKKKKKDKKKKSGDQASPYNGATIGSEGEGRGNALSTQKSRPRGPILESLANAHTIRAVEDTNTLVNCYSRTKDSCTRNSCVYASLRT